MAVIDGVVKGMVPTLDNINKKAGILVSCQLCWCRAGAVIANMLRVE